MIKAIVWGVVGLVILLLAMGSFVGHGISLQAAPGTMSAPYKADLPGGGQDLPPDRQQRC